MFLFWFWFIICVASIFIELFTATALVSIWFALGALVALAVNSLNFIFAIQVTVFFAVSLILFVAIRPIFLKNMRGNYVATNADRIISLRTELLKDIRPGEYGEIKANGILWLAISTQSQNIVAGTIVEVVAIEGSKLVVKAVN